MAAATGVPPRVLRRIIQEVTASDFPVGLKKAEETVGGPSKCWWAVEPGLEGSRYSSFYVEIEGPADYEVNPKGGSEARPSPYRGGWFKFQLAFPTNYPHEVPKVTLLTKTYHTHVSNTDHLKMCADFIGESWTALDDTQKSIFEILKLLRSFLAAPSGDHAVNTDAAKQFIEDVDGYDAVAREFVVKFAGGGDEGDDDDDDDDDDDA